MPEILYTVKQEATSILIKRMNKYISEANEVNSDSAYESLRFARLTLANSRGIYICLKGLGLLSKDEVIGENIDRVQQKIEDILDEKRRGA
jgi:hypothetical protein